MKVALMLATTFSMVLCALLTAPSNSFAAVCMLGIAACTLALSLWEMYEV